MTRGIRKPRSAAPRGDLISDSAERLIVHLDGVSQTGADQWIARCPAHSDRSPSLSVRRTGDRVLVHCFAGCETGDVLAAVGLELKDLFDRPVGHHKAPMSKHQRCRQGQAAEALRALAHESLIVMLAADRLSAGIDLDDNDRLRLHDARDRIQAAFATNGCKLPELPSAMPELRPPSEFAEEVADYRKRVNRGEVEA